MLKGYIYNFINWKLGDKVLSHLSIIEMIHISPTIIERRMKTMKKKTIGTLLALMTMAALTACGTKDIANEAVAMENSNVTIETETGLIVEDAPMIPETEEIVETNEPLTKVYGDFVIYNEAQGEKVNIPLEDFYFLEGEYLLTSDVPIYYTGGKTAGYAKEGTTIKVMDGNTEWLRFKNTAKKDYFTVDFLLVKADELRNATNVEVVTTQKIDEPETELLVSAETQETPKAEKPKTETPAPATSKPVVVEPSTTEPVVVEPETPVVDNTKYTPEEAIAVYRSIMEANGIQWDPSIKEFASWGTGWIYLTKGQPEQAGTASVEAFRMGGGDATHPWTKYYIEVTGSDENAVYFTGWNCD